jgi:hypothetical protein
MFKKTLGIMLVIFTLFLYSTPIYAAKKRVKLANTSTTSSTYTSSAAIYSVAKLSRPTNSVVATFPSMNSVKSISYILSYKSNGMEQGAVGTVLPSGSSTESRDLYFGTCSKGVCTPHMGISNASLLIETTLPNGGIHRKKYIIKI